MVEKSILPFSRVEIVTEWPVEQEGLVEFRLLYEGPLLSSGNHSQVENEHHIRQVLHPQLRRLWWEHLGLRQLAEHRGNVANPRLDATERERFDAGLTAISKEWTKCAFQFVPLVTPDSMSRCSVDILLLRPEGEQVVIGPNGPTTQHFLVNQGDLDGHLKTLFDALRYPDQPSKIQGFSPTSNETPMFCLLSDDKLISQANLNADQLLLLPNHKQVQATDAFAIIHVKINPRYPGAIGNYLG